jgi:hypothetical protein
MKKYLGRIMTLVMVALTIWTTFAANNPVVQIVWYDAVWWRYPNMLWRGSASIISKDGLILTNNHVVDNGRGGTLPWFSICITVDDTQRPKCHYTASLITRDIRRDVALLRIDPTDIFGKAVNFADMTTIELDFNYVPKSQDTVIAVGYPWVGANTITKTQWVVAGTQPYNDVTYIKTDALIAGGNSGGPLVLNNKVIGINTFGMGGFFDPSLWYALSVAEIKDFITSNSTKSATPVSPKLGFAEYLRRLETINIDKKVSDQFVTMKFDTAYKVTHYIPNLQLRGEISNPDIYHVQQFNIQRVNLPKFKDKKEQEYFLKNQMQLYGSRWSTEKLKIKKIGGLEFYEPVYASDPSGGEWYGYKRYFTVIDGTMVIITLYAPLGDENTQEQVKNNIDTFLAGITFGNISILPAQVFELYDPAIKMINSGQTLIDVFGQMDRWFSEYYGWRSSYIQYLGNLYETMGVTVEANTLYDGKGKTAQQLLDAATADSYGSTVSAKWLVNYYGNEGYMICEDNQRNEAMDAQGRSHKMASCITRIVVGTKKEHIITFYLSVTKPTIESRKKEFFALVDQVMKPLWNPKGSVVIADELKTNANKVQFGDISDQDPALQKFLGKLVTRWVLQNKPNFNGDYALQRQDYIPLYLKMVYNKKLTDIWSGSLTYGDIIKTLPYTPSALVPSSQVSYYNSSFETILKIKLAGVAYTDFSEYWLARFDRLKDTLYKEQRNQIQEWEYSIYGQRKIDLYEALWSIGNRQSDYTVTHNPITNITSKTLSYSKEPIKLDLGVSTVTLEDAKDEMSCYTSKVSVVSASCLTLLREKAAQYTSYNVLTKGEAINNLMNKMDIGLFDATRAKKKETQIEEQVIEGGA